MSVWTIFCALPHNSVLNTERTSCSHLTMQSLWNRCVHGRQRTCSDNVKSSMQIVHWQLRAASLHTFT